MSLGNILKEIETNRPQAEMDVTLGTPATYGGRVGLKRAATESIKRLKLQYQKELMTSTLFIVVTGTERDTFSTLASGETFGCFAVDPEDFFKDLTSRLDTRLFGRENVRGLFSIAENILQDKALELDIASYPALRFDDRYNSSVKTAEDFVPLIRNAINDQVGSEIVGINAVYSIVDKAIEKKHEASVTPVVLNTSDEKFALDLQKNLKRLTPNVFLVSAGKVSKALKTAEGTIVVKTVSEDTVGDALSAIRSKISS